MLYLNRKKNEIEERMERTEAAVDKLIEYFSEHGYDATATYMRRTKISMFGYVRR